MRAPLPCSVRRARAENDKKRAVYCPRERQPWRVPEVTSASNKTEDKDAGHPYLSLTANRSFACQGQLGLPVDCELQFFKNELAMALPQTPDELCHVKKDEGNS